MDIFPFLHYFPQQTKFTLPFPSGLQCYMQLTNLFLLPGEIYIPHPSPSGGSGKGNFQVLNCPLNGLIFFLFYSPRPSYLPPPFPPIGSGK